MKPPYFQDSSRKSDNSGILIAKVTIWASSTHTRVNGSEGDGITLLLVTFTGKVGMFWAAFVTFTGFRPARVGVADQQ